MYHILISGTILFQFLYGDLWQNLEQNCYTKGINQKLESVYESLPCSSFLTFFNNQLKVDIIYFIKSQFIERSQLH